MTSAAWAVSDNEHLAVWWRCRGCNDQWMNSSNALDGFLLPVGIRSPVWFSALLHMTTAPSHYWFLKLVPFGTGCASADSCKQTKRFWKFPGNLEGVSRFSLPALWKYKHHCIFLHLNGHRLRVFWSWQGFESCLSNCFPLLSDSLPSSEIIRTTWIVRLIYFFVGMVMKWNRHKPRVSIIRRLILGSDILI